MPLGTHNPIIPGCGLHHISIMTQDYAEAVRFYRDVLGMPLRLEFYIGERPYALLDMGDGSYIELQAPKPETAAQAAGNPVVHFALATTDVRASIEKVRAAGYAVTMEPKDVQLNTLPASVAFFTGPSGESVELFQEK
ncbi:MAG: VOC family protein [Desulfobacterales bacterium]|nr:VOC family protein [Desulfobacterales bacterium]